MLYTDETKRNVFTFLTHLWHFHLSVMKRLLLPWAAHGSRCACVLLCCILITKWFDSRDQTPVEPGMCLSVGLSLSVSFLLANLYDLVELKIFLHFADKHLFYLETGKHLTRLQEWLSLRLISMKSIECRSTAQRSVYVLCLLLYSNWFK